MVGPDRSVMANECRLSAGFSPAWMYLRGVSTLAWNTLQETREGQVALLGNQGCLILKSGLPYLEVRVALFGSQGV